MQPTTVRLHGAGASSAYTDEEDPYSFVPRKTSDPELTLCHGERVLHETSLMKRSRWLRQWRPRWLVVTRTLIATFRSERGYAIGESATEEVAIDSLGVGSVRILDAAALVEEGIPTSRAGAIVSILTPERDVLLDFTTDDGSHGTREQQQKQQPLSASDIARHCATAVVNARCGGRLHLKCYELPGVKHAFEPRGSVSLHERHHLGAELGKGAHGTVYVGKCLQSGKVVALKQISLRGPRERERARLEMRIMRLVASPHVVQLLDYHETWSVATLVMELLPGGDLYSQVVERYCKGSGRSGHGQQQHGYSEAQVRDILRMALCGVAALHDEGVVHRDLKPENVLLVDRRGGLLDLRIADFGAATQLSSSETACERVGTPGYMAPEVVMALPYAHNADMWSLGVLLFTLLCGRHPFEASGHDDDALDHAVTRGHWSFADSNWADVSDGAKDLVRRLLHNAPNKRPSAHKALSDAWVRPTTQPHDGGSGGATGSSRSVGGSGAKKGSTSLSGSNSLPGSSSLSELTSLAGGGGSRGRSNSRGYLAPRVAVSRTEMALLSSADGDTGETSSSISIYDSVPAAPPSAPGRILRTATSADPLRLEEHVPMTPSAKAALWSRAGGGGGEQAPAPA